MGFSGGSDGKSIFLHCEGPGFDPWVENIPPGVEWLPTPVFLPGGFHGQKGLAGYSPGGHRESDTTERLSLGQKQLCTFTSLPLWDGH